LTEKNLLGNVLQKCGVSVAFFELFKEFIDKIICRWGINLTTLS